MRRSRFHSLVWIVVIAVVALLGVTTGSAVAHELQHAAHHDAAMHGSGICAWMCATAGVHVVTPVHATHMLGLSGDAPFLSGTRHLLQLSILCHSRAPPVSL
jgi:hypothetical protein